MKTEISELFNKKLLGFLRKKTDLKKKFKFDMFYNVLYSFLPAAIIGGVVTIVSVKLAGVFGNGIFMLYFLMFLTWPIMKYFQKKDIKKMDDYLWSYLYGDKMDEIKNVFNYYYMNYSCADYFRFREFSHLQLREYMMDEKNLSSIKNEIISEIGENEFLNILNIKEIKRLIKEQNGISWYCMSEIVQKVNDIMSERSADSLIKKIARKSKYCIEKKEVLV